MWQQHTLACAVAVLALAVSTGQRAAAAQGAALDGIWLFSLTGEGPTDNAVIFAGPVRHVIVREHVYPPERFAFDGERLSLPDQHDWPGETIRFSGADRFVANDGNEPLAHWRGTAGEPMDALIAFARQGWVGDLARDVLAVWAAGGEHPEILAATGIVPAIALMPDVASTIPGWGLLLAVDDRAAGAALAGLSLETTDGPAPFHLHPARPLALATDPANAALIAAFLAY